MIEIRCWESSNGRKPVKEWLAELQQFDELAFKKVDKLFEILRHLGRDMGLPGCRNLGEGLFELRDMSRGPGFRIYCTWVDNVLVVLLTAGDKSSQDRDIETARRRLGNMD